MKTEDIKVRLNNLSKRGLDGYAAKEDFQVNAESDIEYLLSILEQAEKALADIEELASRSNIDDFAYYQLAGQALKAIRGN